MEPRDCVWMCTQVWRGSNRKTPPHPPTPTSQSLSSQRLCGFYHPVALPYNAPTNRDLGYLAKSPGHHSDWGRRLWCYPPNWGLVISGWIILLLKEEKEGRASSHLSEHELFFLELNGVFYGQKAQYLAMHLMDYPNSLPRKHSLCASGIVSKEKDFVFKVGLPG